MVCALEPQPEWLLTAPLFYIMLLEPRSKEVDAHALLALVLMRKTVVVRVVTYVRLTVVLRLKNDGLRQQSLGHREILGEVPQMAILK